MNRYKNPPITEAVIDLGVSVSDSSKLEDLKPLSVDLRSEFSDSDEIQETDFVLSVNNESSESQAKRRNVGYRLRTSDKRWLLQARLDHFTLSQLHSYEDWKSFQGRARAYWPYYRDLLKPKTINRIGVRYVNRITIPKNESLESYLNGVPGIPGGLEGEEHFFLQIKKNLEDIKSTLILNYATVAPTDNETKSIILDIDLYRQDIWDCDSEEAWVFLDVLRAKKNHFFETCITEKYRECIK